jgi:hypothetical protein
VTKLLDAFLADPFGLVLGLACGIYVLRLAWRWGGK